MGYYSTISSKGQLTVPQEIRKRLGLEPGDRVEFVMEPDRTVIRPARTEANPFEKFIGIAEPGAGPIAVEQRVFTAVPLLRDSKGRVVFQRPAGANSPRQQSL